MRRREIDTKTQTKIAGAKGVDLGFGGAVLISSNPSKAPIAVRQLMVEAEFFEDLQDRRGNVIAAMCSASAVAPRLDSPSCFLDPRCCIVPNGGSGSAATGAAVLLFGQQLPQLSFHLLKRFQLHACLLIGWVRVPVGHDEGLIQLKKLCGRTDRRFECSQKIGLEREGVAVCELVMHDYRKQKQEVGRWAGFFLQLCWKQEFLCKLL